MNKKELEQFTRSRKTQQKWFNEYLDSEAIGASLAVSLIFLFFLTMLLLAIYGAYKLVF